MTTVDIYARISNDQTDERTAEAERVENQVRDLTAWIAARGWTAGDTYVDNDISATNGRRRPDFDRLLARPVQRPVAVTHIDRLLRKSAKDLERVLDTGMTVYAKNSGDVDLATPAGRATARTLVAWAQAETETKAQRQKDRNTADAAKGRPYWRRRPFGWSLGGTLVESEAQAIVEGCARILAGWSLAAVTRAWNEAGLRTPALAKEQQAGKFPLGDRDWTTQGVRRVLTAARIAGIREYNGIETPGTWTPAVPEETWRAVRGVLLDPARGTSPRTGKVAQSLLAGMATCGKCGGLMHSDKSRNDVAYRCTTNRHLLRKAAPIDDAVVDRTARLLTLPGVFEAVHEDDADVDRAALLTERRALLHRRDVEVPNMVVIGLNPAQIKAANDAINARLTEVDKALDQTTPDGAVLGAVRDAETGPVARAAWLSGIWEPMPLEGRRAVVRALWHVTVPGPEIAPTALAQRLLDAAGVPEDWQ